MVQFPCRCGHKFNLTDDQAGGLIQCPRCGLLNDIPTLSDLANLNPDGTIKFDPVDPAEVVALADLHRAFSNRTTDNRGREVDLRNRPDRTRAIGSPSAPDRVAPRYDPLTGELIRPLGLKDEAPIPVLPLAEPADEAEIDSVAELPKIVLPRNSLLHPAPRSLTYATAELRQAATLKNLAGKLFLPANFVVLIFVFLLLLAAYLLRIPFGFYAAFLGISPGFLLLLNFPLWLTAAHLGCCVQDTGPDGSDELPRPLRNFAFGEDLFDPAARVFLAILICFGPAVVAARALNFHTQTAPAGLLELLLVLGGASFFPAVVLTAVAGTTVLNLSPPRVLGVVRSCGGQYLLSVAVLLLLIVLLLYGLIGPTVLPDLALLPLCHAGDYVAILFLLLSGSIYTAHYFAFHLGLMYRAHHHSFDWLAQRHIPRNRPTDPTPLR